MHMEIPIFRPSISKLEKDYVSEVLALTHGNIISRFEEKLARFFNVNFAIVTNNGTAARHLLLCALDIKRGDKIVCSVNSDPSVPMIIRLFDAEPIFCDVEDSNYNICPKALDLVLTTQKHKKLKAFFVSHVGGQPAQMDKLMQVASHHGVTLLDDACFALGAKFGTQNVGSFGLAGCIQINPQLNNSPASTGAILTNDSGVASRARLLRSHAIVNDSLSKNGNIDYIYDVVDIGCKYDLNTLAAAFNMAQFERTAEFVAKRKAIAAKFTRAFKGLPNLKNVDTKSESVFSSFAVEVERNRDSFARKLKEAGISTMLHYIPLHLLTYYKKKYNHKIGDFPNALKHYQRYLSLPIFEDLTDAEVEYIIENVRRICGEN